MWWCECHPAKGRGVITAEYSHQAGIGRKCLLPFVSTMTTAAFVHNMIAFYTKDLSFTLHGGNYLYSESEREEEAARNKADMVEAK